MSVCLGSPGTRTSRYLARFYDQKIHTGRKIRLRQVRWLLNILYWLQIHLPPFLPLGVQDHLGPFWGSLLSLHRSQRPLTKPWASEQEPDKLKGNGSILHPPANQGNSEHPAFAPHLICRMKYNVVSGAQATGSHCIVKITVPTKCYPVPHKCHDLSLFQRSWMLTGHRMRS